MTIRPAVYWIVAVLAATAAAAALDDGGDYVDEYVTYDYGLQRADDDVDAYATSADDDQPLPIAWPVQNPRDDVMPNKCTDPISGKKYKVGMTWYPEGCGRRTCFYSTEHNMALVHTEKCSCKGCPRGMQCSIVERVVATDTRYPQCCPTTICVPVRSFWSYFKNDYFKDPFAKLHKSHF